MCPNNPDSEQYMTYRKIVLCSISIIISLAVGYFAGQQSGISFAQNNSHKVKTKQNVKPSNCERKLTIGEDKEIYAEIKRVNESPLSGDSTYKESDKLSIYDEKRKKLYELKDFEISDIQTVRLLAPNSREIMITRNGGGTDDFLTILKYEKGKIIEALDTSETQFRGGYFTMLQYRTGMDGPYFKPSQLIVIQQIGGIDTNPSASVFREKGGKLQKAGEIQMQELGDFIEKQIAKNK